MEEAYAELFQEFLRLRELCMKQATMLRQLTSILMKHKGVTGGRAEMGDLESIPVQCTHQNAEYHLHNDPQQLTDGTHNFSAQLGADVLPGNIERFSNLLADDISKLGMNVHYQRKEDRRVQHKEEHPSLESAGWHRAPCNVSQNPTSDPPIGAKMLETAQVTRTFTPSPLVEFMSGGMLMSDVALQSHTCEFCQAVFPGDATSKGEFLRHLCTHVT